MSIDIPRGLINLAEDALGAEALWVSDDFFAAKERMLGRAEPVLRAGTFDEHGQWMDGWESRRRRGPGHDACVVKLAFRGVIRLVDVDTRHFTGNYPPQASLEATGDADPTQPGTRWTTLLPAHALQGDQHNLFPIDDDNSWRSLRLNIFPDGGIARLRVWGEVRPDWTGIGDGELFDLFAVAHGGVAICANDQHYGHISNLNRPGRGVNMGDGWETRRRREPGHDWVLVKLGHAGTIHEVEIDTAHFRGNFPDRVSLQGARAGKLSDTALAASSMHWPLLLPEQPVREDAQHRFQKELVRLGPLTHVRMNLHPDGGVSRLRLFGKIARS